ncbi:hypothetical protein F0919_14470 [Taibaiella lutea]|uniref:Uncharacterized protein n=1 Tax=Taibaiella lutea TaxID=2608001 RepID=A0A5M6CFK3_9BACT|nr:pyocin knob domain-containing protein [Taibaiella lutea]KAA5533733.1 hypothetical protein F0919_14470 [Taibaiella lutea]
MINQSQLSGYILSSNGTPVRALSFVPSSDSSYIGVYAQYGGNPDWVPLNIGLSSVPTLQQVRDMNRNISMNEGSYEDAHFYLRSAAGNNVTTAFYTNADGGAIQSGDTDSYTALNLQPLGGLLTYGGNEVATTDKALVKRDTVVTNFNTITTSGIYTISSGLTSVTNYPHIGNNNNGATGGLLVVYNSGSSAVQYFYPDNETGSLDRSGGFWYRKTTSDPWSYKNGVLEIKTNDPAKVVIANDLMIAGDYMIVGNLTSITAAGYPPQSSDLPLMLTVRKKFHGVSFGYSVTQEAVSMQESSSNLTRKWIRSLYNWNGGSGWDSWNEVGLLRDVYTKTQLNTSGAGGTVHWNNISNAPSFLTSIPTLQQVTTAGNSITNSILLTGGTNGSSLKIDGTNSTYNINTSSANGYARGVLLYDSNGTTKLGGIGFYSGSPNTLTYGWAGTDYNNSILKWNSTGIGIKLGSTIAPLYPLDINIATINYTQPIANFSQNGGSISIQNASSGTADFNPIIKGTFAGTNPAYGLALLGQGSDTFTSAAVVLRGANAAGTSTLNVGNVVEVQNYTTKFASIDYLGNFKLVNSGSFIKQSSQSTKIINNVAELITAATATTGCIVIKHAFSAANLMQDFKIKIWSYALARLAEIRITFYLQSTGIISASGKKSYIIASSSMPAGFENINVGFDASGNLSIMIADVSTSWSTYLRVTVEQLILSHSNWNTLAWESGWSVTTENDLSAYTGIVNIPIDVMATQSWVNTTINGSTNFIQNQNTASQTADFRIAGTGRIDNWFAIGGTGTSTVKLYNRGNITGGTTSYGTYNLHEVQTDVTTIAYGQRIYMALAASASPASIHYLRLSQGTLGGSNTVNNQYGIYIDDLTIGSNNCGIVSNLSSGTNKWNLYLSGSADNYMAGSLGIGITKPTPFAADAIAFPALVPKMEIVTGITSAVPYAEGIVVRHTSSGGANPGNREVGLFLKLGDELTSGASSHGAAITVGTSNTFSNAPDMNFYILNSVSPVMQILNNGNVKAANSLGIGVSPSYKLDVNAGATTGVFANFSVAGGSLQFGNSGTTTTAAPTITFTSGTTTVGAYQLFRGTIDSYSTGAAVFRTYNAAGTGGLTGGKAFVFQNYTTNIFTIDYQGVIGIPNLIGTGTRIVVADSLGNLSSITNNFLTSISGTTNRIVVTGTTVDIASTYVGQTSITTLGTISTGTWNGTTIAVNKGGTGVTALTGVTIGNGTSAMTGLTGTAGQLLRRNASNTAYEFFTSNYLTDETDPIYTADKSKIWSGENTTKTNQVSNFNQALPSGVYNAFQATGTAINEWEVLLHMRHVDTNNNYGADIISTMGTSPNPYLGWREISNGSYGAWHKIWTSADFPSTNSFIINQNASSQSGNMWIDGRVVADHFAWLDGSTIKLDSSTAFIALYTAGSAAQSLKTGGLTISDSYSDSAPSNGLFVKGNLQLNSLNGSGTRMVVADADGVLSTQPIGSLVSQWVDNTVTTYNYLSANDPNIGGGKGIYSNGGYASNYQELIVQNPNNVEDNVEFIYRIDQANSDCTLSLPDPSVFPNRVLNITNFSTDTDAGIILDGLYMPMNTEIGTVTDYLSSVKGDITLPQWIQVMSIQTTVGGNPDYYWMVIKAGRKTGF